MEKYLNDECTSQEKALVEKHLSEEENLQLMEEVIDMYWQSIPEEAIPEVDTVSSLERYKAKLQLQKLNKVARIKTTSNPVISREAIQLAASILLTMATLITIFWYTTSGREQHAVAAKKINYHEITNAKGQQAHVVLPDSSQVWLQADSYLKYPKIFSGTERTIWLSGEAFMEVAEDKHKPFVVHTKHLVTTVLGTSFHIRAYEDEKQAKITVATGIVAIEKQDREVSNASVFLHPNQRVVLDKASNQLYTDSVGIVELTSLKNGELYLKDMYFGEIAHQLERRYGVAIEFENKTLLNCQFSAVFSRRSLNDILKRLQMTSNFTYTYDLKNRKVKINGNCK